MIVAYILLWLAAGAFLSMKADEGHRLKYDGVPMSNSLWMAGLLFGPIIIMIGRRN